MSSLPYYCAVVRTGLLTSRKLLFNSTIINVPSTVLRIRVMEVTRL